MSRICFIRHGESTVNAQAKLYRAQDDPKPGRAYHEAKFFDAPLNPEGVRGAEKHVQAELRRTFKEQDITSETKIIRLAITSTLRRTLETTSYGVLPVFPPSAFMSYVALECVREATGCEVNPEGVFSDVTIEKPCNLRSNLQGVGEGGLRGRRSEDTEVDQSTGVASEFDYIDFSQCPDADPLDPLETVEDVDTRIREFLAWLCEWRDQQQKQHGSDVQMEVTVVSHSVFLYRLLSRLEPHGHVQKSAQDSTPKPEPATPSMKNCEVRTLWLESILEIQS